VQHIYKSELNNFYLWWQQIWMSEQQWHATCLGGQMLNIMVGELDATVARHLMDQLMCRSTDIHSINHETQLYVVAQTTWRRRFALYHVGSSQQHGLQLKLMLTLRCVVVPQWWIKIKLVIKLLICYENVDGLYKPDILMKWNATTASAVAQWIHKNSTAAANVLKLLVRLRSSKHTWLQDSENRIEIGPPSVEKHKRIGRSLFVFYPGSRFADYPHPLRRIWSLDEFHPGRKTRWIRINIWETVQWPLSR